MKSILNLAHRGASAHIDENTIQAVQLAYEMGADGCEIDVHVCRTGEMIVMHDKEVDSTTDGKGLITDLTLSEIKKYRTASGYEVPTLREVLTIIPNDKLLNIELKGVGSGHAFIDRWKEFYQPLIAAEQLIFSSFRESELKQIPANTFKIASFVDDPDTGLFQIVTANRFSVHMRGDVADEQSIAFFHDKGLKAYVWTVNEPEEMRRLIRQGADGIFTDDPRLLQSVL
jgi:glycerophosphoryl diester phosphodiesterase